MLTAPFERPFARSRAHVVLVQRFQHARARHARDDGHEYRESASVGSMRWTSTSPSATQSPCMMVSMMKKPVPPLGCRSGEDAPARGQDVQDAREQQDEQDARPEDGHGHAHQRYQHAHVVRALFFFTAASTPSAHAYDGRHDDGADGQLGRGGEARGYLLGDRLVGVIRGSEVALQRAHDEVHVLEPDGVVKPVVRPPGRHRLGRGVLAQDHGGRVWRQHARDEEDDDGYTQQDGNHHEDSFEDVLEHLLVLSCMLPRPCERQE